jgi:ribosomal protein L29
VNHGIVDVFAFQEALLIEALFGIVLLTMAWVGYRRWLQHKADIARMAAQQAAEREAISSASIERLEARLATIEQALTDGRAQTASGALPGPGDGQPDS